MPGVQFLVTLVACWLNRHQLEVIEYLQDENRLLRERHGPKRLRFTDAQRRQHAVAAKWVGERA